MTLRHRSKITHVGDIPVTHITESELFALMRVIYAKHTLTDEEIVCAHLRGNVRRHRDLLTIHGHRSQDPISFMLTAGSDWIHAIVVRPGDVHPFTGDVKPK